MHDGTAWGYLNAEGTMVIPPRFDEAYGFDQGVAAVVQDGVAGYIDTDGRRVWPR